MALLAGASAAHGQLLLAIDPEQPLVVDHMPFTSEQNVQPSIAERNKAPHRGLLLCSNHMRRCAAIERQTSITVAIVAAL
jgi:hypothetical protein